MIWGDGEADFIPTRCEAVARPEDIPADNLTTPVWPKHFTQTMVNLAANTRGLSPCSPKNWGKKDTYYDQIDFGLPPPLDGPQPVQRTSDARTGSADPHPHPDPYPAYHNTLLGPLRWDFPRDSLLVGRERIFVEYANRTVVADHWTKGPHHFWFEVATNLMWDLAPPDPSVFEVPRGCYAGLLHKNMSCVAPPPGAAAA
eukprot:gene16-8031_t